METRSIEHGLRRRRVCLQGSCNGRLSTLEVMVPDRAKHDGRDFVLVRKIDLERLRSVLAGAMDGLVTRQVFGWRDLVDVTGDAP